MASGTREYDIVVFGATGYTGKLCAEHITTHLPTDLKWAVAGRSPSKLASLTQEILSLNPDRIQPGIEIAELRKEDLHALARKTRLIINTVGPYYKFGAPVVEACASNGTHHLDVTGETPWVRDMIEKYHETAKANGAIIISELGIQSAIADLATWSLVTCIRQSLSVPTQDVILAINDLWGSPSGGTSATITGILDHYSIRDAYSSITPYAISPVQPGSHQLIPNRPGSFLASFLNIHTIPDLGTLTTHIPSYGEVPIVQRSWGLLGAGSFYGPKFHFSEYKRVRNVLGGVLISILSAFAMLALFVPPVRWALRVFLPAPGQGPSKEAAAKDRIDLRGIAIADQPNTANPQRASLTFKHQGSHYYLTAVFITEAAIVILREENLAKKLGGGCLTPATLGGPYLDRLSMAGVRFETRILSN